MASPVPAKSQPLHNFPLPSLWSNRGPRHSASSPPPHRLSPSLSSDSRGNPTIKNCHPPPPPPLLPLSDRKISIKIRGITPTETRERETNERENEEEGEGDEDETLAKVWNLRSMKPIKKRSGKNEVKTLLPEKKPTQEADCGGDKKDKKLVKFSISLSKSEIEEDLFAMTGSKLSRRPKKRTKTVQKQLDAIFPGLWLASITPDSYKVNEEPYKA